MSATAPARFQGLSTAEAAAALAQHGPNRLPEPPLPSVLTLFGRQFLSPFIYILIAAAGVSFALGQTSSGVFITAVLLLNAVIGTVQEYSAQKSAAALRTMIRGVAHVVRDGVAVRVDAEAVVPGDLILLSSGNKVPADVDLLQTHTLAADESMLTGESLAVTKDAAAPLIPDAPLAERPAQAFAGTLITQGRGQGIVRATGLNTQLGQIAKSVTKARVSEPPLTLRIRQFTYQVAAAIGVAILLLVGILLAQGGYGTTTIILMVIGLAVSTIPEGLPAALTVALAIGMRRMARHNVIIRKLVAVEALGSCTFIASDKTGTLTVNQLTIRGLQLPDGTHFDVTGEGIAPGGSIGDGTVPEAVQELCTAGVLANESHLDYAGGDWVADGDIVDVAFLVLAKKAGLSLSTLRESQRQLDLIPYESERAFAGSLNEKDGQVVLYAKGSPEKMLDLSEAMLVNGERMPLDRAGIQTRFEALASQGYRVLALARRVIEHRPEGELERVAEGMTLLGLVAMIDPIRPEALDAVAKCRAGGIQVAMVTGDHPATARAIGAELGLCDPDAQVVTGQKLREAEAEAQRLGDPTLVDRLIAPVRVFARIEPAQKEQIVDSFQRAGHFVAVTGDGANDAPALRQAQVGIAMGDRGTDVARETADLILTDDNFASIVDGIEQGRIVYNNIRKVIALLIATGFSAILLFLSTALAGLPMPLLAVQLLWLNLVANGLQDVALAFEPGEGHELKARPRDPAEPIFDHRVLEHVVITGAVMGLAAFGTFWWLLEQGTPLEEARNGVLMLMVLFGNLHALNSRSETTSLFRLPLIRNPFLLVAVPAAQLIHIAAMYTPGLSTVLEIQPIQLSTWVSLLAIAASLVLVEEAHKAWHRHRAP